MTRISCQYIEGLGLEKEICKVKLCEINAAFMVMLLLDVQYVLAHMNLKVNIKKKKSVVIVEV